MIAKYNEQYHQARSPEKSRVMALFSLFGDHSLPERSHLNEHPQTSDHEKENAKKDKPAQRH